MMQTSTAEITLSWLIIGIWGIFLKAQIQQQQLWSVQKVQMDSNGADLSQVEINSNRYT